MLHMLSVVTMVLVLKKDGLIGHRDVNQVVLVPFAFKGGRIKNLSNAATE